MELKKPKRGKYFTKALQELGAQGFSEEEVSSFANITVVVDYLIMWHKEMNIYIEGDTVYIKLNTGKPGMVDKVEGGAI